MSPDHVKLSRCLFISTNHDPAYFVQSLAPIDFAWAYETAYSVSKRVAYWPAATAVDPYQSLRDNHVPGIVTGQK